MPSVSRRNQLLKVLDQVSLEFQGYRRVYPSQVNVPLDAQEIMEKYNFPRTFGLEAKVREHFTTIISVNPTAGKPEFTEFLVHARDDIALAQNEADVAEIFERIEAKRQELLAWQKEAFN